MCPGLYGAALGFLLSLAAHSAYPQEPRTVAVVIDHASLVRADCEPVSAAVDAMRAALPHFNMEVLVAWGHETVRPSPTATAVRSTLCDSPVFRESTTNVSAAEAFEIERRNEAVRDRVIHRICGAAPASGCGARVGAEARAVVDELRDRSDAFLAILEKLIQDGSSDAVVVVSAGPPTRRLSDRARGRLKETGRAARVRTALLAIPRDTGGALAVAQGQALSAIRDALDATVLPLRDRDALTRALAERFVVSRAPEVLGRGASESAVDTSEILERAAAHVAAFAREASVVLAIENYDQVIKSRSGSFGLSGTTRMGIIRQRRTLRSEVALVQVLDGSLWMIARDVLEVDGRALSEHPSLAATIPTDDVQESLQYLREVADANARFNIGDIRRNLNTPTLALLVLTDAFRHRFAFRAEKVDAAGTTVLHFEEDVEPTVFQVNAASALSTGRFWVDARTGAVRRTELVLASNVGTAARATITVDYEPVAEAGAWMPLRMTEKYEVPGQRESDWIECTATYSNYKRFSVTTRIK